MKVIERSVVLPTLHTICTFGTYLWKRKTDEMLIRLVVEKVKDDGFHCSINIVKNVSDGLVYPIPVLLQ